LGGVTTTKRIWPRMGRTKKRLAKGAGRGQKQCRTRINSATPRGSAGGRSGKIGAKAPKNQGVQAGSDRERSKRVLPEDITWREKRRRAILCEKGVNALG